MRLRDTCRFSLANLFRQKLRSLLTMIGVAVGTGAIVVMVSLGEGIRSEFVKLLSAGESLTMIQVMQFKPTFSFRRDRRPSIRKLRDEDVDTLGRLDGVLAAWPNLQMLLKYERDGREASAPVFPIPREAVSRPLRDALLAGDFWKGDGAWAVVPLWVLNRHVEGQGEDAETIPSTPQEAEAFVGKTFAFTFSKREPFPKVEGVPIEGPDEKGVRRVRCTIVGVYDDDKVGGMEQGILIPLGFGKALRGLAEPQIGVSEEGGITTLGAGEYRSIIVKARSIEEMPRVKERVDALGYPSLTVEDVVSVVDKVALVMKAVLGCIGGIGLIVALFGIVNTMLMAILERTREIGMLKALGARNRDIRRVFSGEAVAIGLLGSLAGLGGGWAVGAAMNAIAKKLLLEGKRFEDVNLFRVSPWLGAGAVLFGVFVAWAAGLLPAIRASRLDPVTALRHE